ncbi:SNF2 family protein [Streptococcus viridans]|uniref:SNF2 family protein n=1 Tax=Streptococcus viridans TaxID=78535 RepID=A0ABD7NIM5_9STRE|nr:SNF2 family protein [Streptococcus viridans]
MIGGKHESRTLTRDVAGLPRDPSLLESFLRYQAAHFDEDWDSLIQHFMTHRGEVKPLVQVVQFETDVSAFVAASPFEAAHDLLTYTQTFGQVGLNKLPQLSTNEKALVIEVALFNLATRFQLLDQEGAYQSISVSSLLEKGRAANLVMCTVWLITCLTVSVVILNSFFEL